MFIGHGSKNQFRYINDLKSVLKTILEKIPKDSAILYFGDTLVGCVFDGLIREEGADSKKQCRPVIVDVCTRNAMCQGSDASSSEVCVLL